ncbi:MAG: carbohydrate binding family 9 domain-containing protein, partial [Acidobacteria bacterium]|nr:carbohydrate binding family 9 domain-containing protein [Acidobacteriota bacterium]
MKEIIKIVARMVLRSLCLVACGAVAVSAQVASVSPTPSPAAVVNTAGATAGKAQPEASKPMVKGGVALPPEKAQPVRVARFETPPVIDGKLDEEVWKQAAVLKDFYQTNPGDNIAPTASTEFLIGYDSKFLYLAFRAFDDPSKVRATVARRDNVFGEDNVRVLLDTFNDQRKAYVLGFNPFGIQQDGIMTEGGGTDYSVDIVMESKGTLTSDGYIVEVAVPFKSLRYEAGKGKFWGIHAWRNIDRNSDELDSWMPISRGTSGTLNQAGRITGLEGISTERTLELIPSLTVSETGRLVRTDPSRGRGIVDFGAFVNEPIALEPGLTAKFVVSSAMTLDLAVNPDFAQVEADQLVVTTNQRFPIFFAEKRPFFLEGIEIFRTPLTAVHTRAIVDPDLALKLSGKRGRNTYGVMFASDNGPGNLGFDDRAFLGDTGGSASRREQLLKVLDKNATIGVVRLKRDIGRENNIGLIATTYNFIDRHNHTAGVDGR